MDRPVRFTPQHELQHRVITECYAVFTFADGTEKKKKYGLVKHNVRKGEDQGDETWSNKR